MKRCHACDEDKPLDQYNNFSRSKDKLAYECRPCSRQKQRDYMNSKTEEERVAHHRKVNLKRSFGITPEDYDTRLLRQGGACAICNKPEKTIRAGKLQCLSVDHCHSTGTIRGLLCNNCNRALGMFKDDVEILRSSIIYLEGYTT